MDRPIIYPGSIPLADDLLKSNQYAMAAIGRLTKAMLGTGTNVLGLACTPPAVPGLSVQVGPGEIYSLSPLEASDYSTLPADTGRTIVKQGYTDGATFNTPAPTTTGTSINYLIQATYADADTANQVLPYYNSANPAQPFSGPGNDGSSQPTVRAGRCVLSLKAGVAATTGSQTTPSPDTGYVGLWVITVANGATTVSSGNIVKSGSAPFLPDNGLLAAVPTVPVASVAGKTGAVTLVVGDVSGAAPLASPIFTGDPKAPTPAAGDNDTTIATTAFVQAALAPLINGVVSGASQITLPSAGGFQLKMGVYSGYVTEGVYGVTFDNAFPNSCCAVVATCINSNAGSGRDLWAEVQNWSKNGFNAFMNGPPTSGNVREADGFTWFAIGN